MIYFFRPEISGFTDKKWSDFFDGALEVLEKFKPYKVTEVINLKNFPIREENPKNLLIYFVPTKETNNIVKRSIEKALKEAVKNKWKIYPIAPDKNNRLPSDIVDTSQSYDIVNELNQRKLTDSYYRLVGGCFARVVIVSHFTASFKKETKLFLSHRRKDAEDKANFIKEATNSRHEKIYIDLHEITVGEDAQNEIEKKLKEDTDILVFIQTPSTYESKYQLIELKRALELDIPILWVTLGFENGSKDYELLPIHPVGKPHLQIKELNSKNIQQILAEAFEILSLKKQRLLDKIIYKLDDLESKGLDFKELCDLENIYLISEKKEDGLTGEIQVLNTLYKFLCRKYNDDDVKIFDNYNQGLSYYQGNTIFGMQDDDKEISSVTRLKSYKRLFVSRNNEKINGSIIISGSFPKNQSLKHQMNLIDAISTIVQDILQCGGNIIFGSHPTFQGLILEKAKNFNTLGEKRVKIYASSKFKNRYESNLNYFHENSNFHEIIGKGKEMNKVDISLSLTEMRKAMINDEDAIALVVLGGQEPEDSLSEVPGIDEEIQLAKERGIPVYIIGSVGGRTATLVSNGGSNSLEGDEKIIVENEDNFKLISETILRNLIKN